MIKAELTQDEITILGQYFKTSPLKLIRLKAQAILMRNEGLKLETMARLLLRDQRTVKRWIKDFSKTRMASIFTGHKDNGNASKLTKEQIQQVKETLSKPPFERGLPKEFWDVPLVKEYIRTEFDVIYESRQSYHFLLKFSNLSFKLPAKFDFRRDEALINKRMNEINEEIKEYLNNNDWEIFASDEVRMELEALTRRAWLKKGEKTIIKVNREKEYQNYIGFLNQKTFKCQLYELEWQNQEQILKALELFLKNYPDKRICIIWDNARFHKGKLIRETLKKGKLLERVHLINFPPYAPDKNPIEHVWKEAKYKISNIQFETFDKTKQAFRKEISKRRFNYSISKSDILF